MDNLEDYLRAIKYEREIEKNFERAELEITSVNGVPKDTVVVFKNK